MRMCLQTHPKIVRILSATNSDKFRVIGGLHAVWSVFDQHANNGRLEGYSAKTLDHVIGWDGFSSAMIAVGWLTEEGESLVATDFDDHNGKSAKVRADDSKRKRDARKSAGCPENVRKMSGKKQDKTETREEKRREYKTHPPGFDDFWEAYRKKVGLQASIEQWRLIQPSAELIAKIISSAEIYAGTSEAKYRKDPERWLKARRWEDDPGGAGSKSWADDLMAGAV